MNPAKPLRLVKLEGNRGKRKLPKEKDEVAFADGTPDMPQWMDPEAKAEWKRFLKSSPSKFITQGDRAGLALYCQTWARWVQAEKDGRENASAVLARELRMICREFGMTPSARARMVMPGEKTPDEMDGLLSEAK